MPMQESPPLEASRKHDEPLQRNSGASLQITRSKLFANALLLLTMILLPATVAIHRDQLQRFTMSGPVGINQMEGISECGRHAPRRTAENHPEHQQPPADGSWPPTLHRYVKRAFAQVARGTAEDKSDLGVHLKKLIADSVAINRLWTHDWEKEPLPRFRQDRRGFYPPLALPPEQDATPATQRRPSELAEQVGTR